MECRRICRQGSHPEVDDDFQDTNLRRSLFQFDCDSHLTIIFLFLAPLNSRRRCTPEDRRGSHPVNSFRLLLNGEPSSPAQHILGSLVEETPHKEVRIRTLNLHVKLPRQKQQASARGNKRNLVKEIIFAHSECRPLDCAEGGTIAIRLGSRWGTVGVSYSLLPSSSPLCT